MELVAGTAGPQPSLPGSALSDLLLLHLRRCQQEQHAELSLFFIFFSVALIRQVLALPGPGIITESIQLRVPTRYQSCSEQPGCFSCRCWAWVCGCWGLSRDTKKCSMQLVSQTRDGNDSGHLAGLASTHSWACADNFLGRKTGKRDLRYTFNADRHGFTKQISNIDLPVPSRVSKKKGNTFSAILPVFHSSYSILAKSPKSKHQPEIFNYDFQFIRKKKTSLNPNQDCCMYQASM